MNEDLIELIDAVRKRPAMYIGSTSDSGINHLIDEIVRYSFYFLKADFLELSFISKTKAILLIKNLDIEINVRDMLVPKSNELSIDKFIIGVLIGLSKSTNVSILDVDNKELVKFSFDRDELVQYADVDKKMKPQHIEISFELNDDILTWDQELLTYALLERFKTLAFLYKRRSLALSFFIEKEFSRTIFKFDNGLIDLVNLRKMFGLGGLDFIISIDKHFENFQFEAAIGFNEYTVDAPYLVSFVNERVTHEEGVHVDSVLDGIISALTKFIETSEMPEKEIPKVGILRAGIIAAIHVKIKRPHFEGSVRNKLLNPEIKDDIKNLLESVIFELFSQNKEKAIEVVKVLQRETRIAKYK